MNKYKSPEWYIEQNERFQKVKPLIYDAMMAVNALISHYAGSIDSIDDPMVKDAVVKYADRFSSLYSGEPIEKIDT